MKIPAAIASGHPPGSIPHCIKDDGDRFLGSRRPILSTCEQSEEDHHPITTAMACTKSAIDWQVHHQASSIFPLHQPAEWRQDVGIVLDGLGTYVSLITVSLNKDSVAQVLPKASLLKSVLPV